MTRRDFLFKYVPKTRFIASMVVIYSMTYISNENTSELWETIGQGAFLLYLAFTMIHDRVTHDRLVTQCKAHMADIERSMEMKAKLFAQLDYHKANYKKLLDKLNALEKKLDS